MTITCSARSIFLIFHLQDKLFPVFVPGTIVGPGRLGAESGLFLTATGTKDPNLEGVNPIIFEHEEVPVSYGMVLHERGPSLGEV